MAPARGRKSWSLPPERPQPSWRDARERAARPSPLGDHSSLGSAEQRDTPTPRGCNDTPPYPYPYPRELQNLPAACTPRSERMIRLGCCGKGSESPRGRSRLFQGCRKHRSEGSERSQRSSRRWRRTRPRSPVADETRSPYSDIHSVVQAHRLPFLRCTTTRQRRVAGTVAWRQLTYVRAACAAC